MIEEPTTPLDGGPSACPFVAFEDDRDHRSSSPDYRHRCFAAPEPEPRAFPHQEHYCLSDAFAGCPVFLDWARQEAAAVKAGGMGAATAQPSGATVAGVDGEEDETAPAFLAGRTRTEPTADLTLSSRRPTDANSTLWSYDNETKRSSGPAAPVPPSSLGAPAVAMARRGPSHPGWETPPRLESFPRLRSREDRRANQPLLLVAVGIALVMVTLILFPIITSPSAHSGPVGSQRPLPSYSGSPNPNPSDSAAPRESFFQYPVHPGDQWWAIAKTFQVTQDDLAAANPQVTNPNVLYVGEVLNIPPIDWHGSSASPS